MAQYHTRIGHAHLKVRNLERALAFYTRFFDLDVVEQVGSYAFLSGGEFHHEIALQALGDHAPLASRGTVGLYHVAFEVPDARAFAQAYQALTEAGVAVGAVDHRISWAMYFNDPDGNGLEIYWDTRHLATGASLWHGANLPLSDETIFAALEPNV
ncbi:MAG TPA: VOC family protein [Aggregatilineales bacterium]|nr:VOC family protein [Aggregatilineales bacterium]